MDFFEILSRDTEDVTPEYMREIVEPLWKIDPLLIDDDRSVCVQSPENGVVDIRIFSMDDVCCPLHVALGTQSGLFFFAYGDSAVSTDGYARDESDAKGFKDELLFYLAKDVTEERTKIGDRIARTKYSYPSHIPTRMFNDTTSKMRIWPWSDKKVTPTKYRAWLPSEACPNP